MNRPMITIITATYNAGRELPGYFEAIKYQTRRDFELVLVDGGSTDDSNLIIASNKNLISKYISEKDCGVYDAWNKGLRLASGKYVMFVGSDDRLVPEAIELYERFISEAVEKYDLICSKARYVTFSGISIKEIGEKWDWIEMKKRMAVSHVGMLTSRELLKSGNGFDLRYHRCADYDFLLREGVGVKAGYIDQVTVLMRTGGLSFTIEALSEALHIKLRNLNGRSIRSSIVFLISVVLFYRMKLNILILERRRSQI